jgi:integrase
LRSVAEQSAAVMTQVWHDHLPRACARARDGRTQAFGTGYVGHLGARARGDPRGRGRNDERVRRVPAPDDYLLYPEWRKHGRVYKANPRQPMPRQTIHRWWYERLQRAGLVAKDVERGMNMHRARHTFATELRRDVGDLGVVQRMLGHETFTRPRRTTATTT